jgi:hypothetical protein
MRGAEEVEYDCNAVVTGNINKDLLENLTRRIA